MSKGTVRSADLLCPVVLLRRSNVRRVDIEFRSRHPAGSPHVTVSVSCALLEKGIKQVPTPTLTRLSQH